MGGGRSLKSQQIGCVDKTILMGGFFSAAFLDPHQRGNKALQTPQQLYCSGNLGREPRCVTNTGSGRLLCQIRLPCMDLLPSHQGLPPLPELSTKRFIGPSHALNVNNIWLVPERREAPGELCTGYSQPF